MPTANGSHGSMRPPRPRKSTVKTVLLVVVALFLGVIVFLVGGGMFMQISHPRFDDTPEGSLLWHQDQLRQAQEAVIKSPNSAQAYYALGNQLDTITPTKACVEAYQEAIRLKPEYLDAHLALANVYDKRRDYAKSAKQYQEALLWDPQNAAIYFDLGSAYFNQRDYRDAVKAYEMAASLAPQNSQYLLVLGDTDKAAGLELKARAAWTKVLPLDGGNGWRQQEARKRLTQPQKAARKNNSPQEQ